MSLEKVLVIGEQRGSTAALAPIVYELLSRGYFVDVIASGKETEAAGFGEEIIKTKIGDGRLTYSHQIEIFDLGKKVGKYDVVIGGLTSADSWEIRAIRAANNNGKVLSVGVLDQNLNFGNRFGVDKNNLPQIISVMEKHCIPDMDNELYSSFGDISSRCFVAGWTAFDRYPVMMREFEQNQVRQEIRKKLGIEDGKKLIVYFAVLPPILDLSEHHIMDYYDDGARYHQDVLENINIVSDLLLFKVLNPNVEVVVSPHPREGVYNKKVSTWGEYGSAHLAEMALLRHVKPGEYNFEKLCYSADCVVGSATTAVSAACAMNKNTMSIITQNPWLPLSAYPAIFSNAIPVAYMSEEIQPMLKKLNSRDYGTDFANMRRNFAPDCKASKRLVDEIIRQHN